MDYFAHAQGEGWEGASCFREAAKTGEEGKGSNAGRTCP